MNNFNIPLKNALAIIAKNMLPEFSGQNKLLEIIIHMSYDRGGFQHIKVIFWRPNKAMLVGYNFETHLEDISQEFTVTANHDSTWKHDGLNFFSQIVKTPQSIEILSTKVVTIESHFFNEHGDFSYVLGKLQSV